MFAWGALIVFLMIRAGYLYEQLKRHIDMHYPEEGAIIRSYEWQHYPWSTGIKTLRSVIKKNSANDPELAHRAKKAKRAFIYLIVLPLAIFFIASSIDLYNALTRAK